MKGRLKAVILRLLLTPWERLREPKVQHAAIATAYLLAVVAGVALWQWSPWLGQWAAGLIVAGGLLPLVSLHGGHWGLERAGLTFLAGGLLVYAVSLPQSHPAISVGEIVARAAITGAFVALLCARWYHIRDLDLDPDR